MNKEQKKYPQRTLAQNRSLHLMFTMLADELNDKGLYMQKVLKPSVDILWTPANIKEYIWRPIQKAQLNKESTTELNTVEIDQVLDTITKHMGEKFGVSIVFPSIEELMYKDNQ